MKEEDIRAEHFRQAEASCLLEGMSTAGDGLFQSLKARVIAGEIDIDEMMQDLSEDSKRMSPARTPDLAIAG